MDLNGELDIKKHIGETQDDYKLRICELKEPNGWTWDTVKDIINSELDLNYDESAYRKFYTAFIKGYKMHEEKKMNGLGILSEYQLKILQLKKEKVKLSDERTQLGAYVKKITRDETLGEIAKKCANIIGETKPFIARVIAHPNTGKTGIAQVSDWHYGEIVDNFTNVYNTTIAADRIKRLTEKYIEFGKFHNISTLYVINLNDLVSGIIHLRLRLETRENIVDQVMQVAELFANMLYELSQHFKLEYYSTLDNHSRVDPNKKDSLDLESFARIIDWYLIARFEGHNNVAINQNKLGADICSFDIEGYKFIGVHGDHDSPQKVVSSLSMLTREFYNVILTGHLHHFNCDEQNETVIIANGSLVGSNNYSKQLRLTSKATQNLIIVSKDSPCEAIYRIILN